ncbi:MAG: DUF2723 domain-containing protein [bacterium]|nr:DUF2723 domain-containing protein [bacterium]
MDSKQRYTIGAVSLFLISFLVYFSTLAPTVTWGDSGEFITVAYTLGIGHPTCYPFYTLLGKLATSVPLGNIGWRLNLLSAIAAALSIAVLYFFLRDLLTIIVEKMNPTLPQPEIESKRTEISRQKPEIGSHRNPQSSILIQLSAASGSLLFAFSLTFWDYAVIAEVHTLQILLTVSLFFLWLQWWKTYELRFLYASALTYGLMLAHHYLSLLLFPAFVFITYRCLFGVNIPRNIQNNSQRDDSEYTVKSSKRKPILYAFLLILLGWSCYLYLPIRASQTPLINWNAPNNLSGFLSCLTGGQFKLRMFSTSPGLGMESGSVYLGILAQNITRFISLLGQQWIPANIQFGIISVWLVILVRCLFVGLGIIGIIQGFRLNRFWFGLSLIIVSITLGAVFNYQIADIEPYYLSVYLIGIVWFTLGIYTLSAWLKKNIPQLTILPITVPIVLCLIPLVSHYALIKRKNDYTAYYYAKNTLQSIEKNAVILTAGDNDIFPLWYGKYVEKFNPDVIIFGSNFLTSPWYQTFFIANPEFHLRLVTQLYPSRKAWLDGLFANIIEPNEPKYQFYITFYDPYLAQRRTFIPVGNFLPNLPVMRERIVLSDGFLYRLIKPEKLNHEMLNPKFTIQNPKTYIAQFDGTIYLRQCLIEHSLPLQPGDVFTVTFFWETEKKTHTNYRGFLLLPNTAGTIYTDAYTTKPIFAYKFTPIYSVYSTSQWQPGTVYTEQYRFMIPLNLPADEYHLTMTVFDEKQNVPAVIPSQKEPNPLVICGKIMVTDTRRN